MEVDLTGLLQLLCNRALSKALQNDEHAKYYLAEHNAQDLMNDDMFNWRKYQDFQDKANLNRQLMGMLAELI